MIFYRNANIFSIIVLVFSIVEIFISNWNLNEISIYLSLIGILGFIANILDLKFYNSLYLIWIFLQIPIITITTTDEGIKSIENIFNLSQFVKVDVGFSIVKNPNSYRIAFNFLPLIFYKLYKIEIAQKVVTKTITLFSGSGLSPLNKFIPFKATINKVTNKLEYTAELKNPLYINENIYTHINFKTENGRLLKLGKEGQRCDVTLMCKNNKIETTAYIK